MAKDAISKRLKVIVSSVWEVREQLDGGDVALSIRGDIEPRGSTFELFGLDPGKPRDRQFLLWLLDEIIFGKGKVGAPQKWSEWGPSPSSSQLKADVAAINHGSTKKKSDREICRLLKEDKRFEERYAKKSLDAIRRQLRNIR
jgi:hypothetical protein